MKKDGVNVEHKISEALQIGRGVTALIGGGGKTTLMYALAEELKARGNVVICTSTAILPPDAYAVLLNENASAVRDALAKERILCVGTVGEDRKLHAPALSFDALQAIADYVIVEADGSRHLPLKAHAPHEPVIPACAGRTVLVAGIDGIGRPIRETCHRPELYASLAGADPEAAVTPAMAARVIAAEGFGDIVFINKAEGEAELSAARALAAYLPCPAVIGSLIRREYLCLS